MKNPYCLTNAAVLRYAFVEASLTAGTARNPLDANHKFSFFEDFALEALIQAAVMENQRAYFRFGDRIMVLDLATSLLFDEAVLYYTREKVKKCLNEKVAPIGTYEIFETEEVRRGRGLKFMVTDVTPLSWREDEKSDSEER